MLYLIGWTCRKVASAGAADAGEARQDRPPAGETRARGRHDTKTIGHCGEAVRPPLLI